MDVIVTFIFTTDMMMKTELPNSKLNENPAAAIEKCFDSLIFWHLWLKSHNRKIMGKILEKLLWYKSLLVKLQGPSPIFIYLQTKRKNILAPEMLPPCS